MKTQIWIVVLLFTIMRIPLCGANGEGSENTLQKKLEQYLVDKKGNPIDPQKNPDAYKKALDQFADAIIQHIKLQREIKERAERETGKFLRERQQEMISGMQKHFGKKKIIPQEPFTQTLAYLNPKHIKNFDYEQKIVELCKAFMRKPIPAEDIILDDEGNVIKTINPFLPEEPNDYETKLLSDIIINEQFHNDYYVFYHGSVGYKDGYQGPRILFDTMTEIARWFDINSYSKAMMLRLFKANEAFTDVNQFFADKIVTENLLKVTAFDEEERKYLLAANISLFGRMASACPELRQKDNSFRTEANWEFTLNYFLGNSSDMTGISSILASILQSFDLNKYAELLQNYRKHMKLAGGYLLQIFIAKDSVDKVAYLSKLAGWPLFTKKDWVERISLSHRNVPKEFGGNEEAAKRVSSPLLPEGNFDLLFKTFGKNFESGSGIPISMILQQYIKNPDFIHFFSQPYITPAQSAFYCGITPDIKLPWFDALQARLLIVPSIFADRTKVKIFHYYSKQPIDEVAYQKDLSKIFEDIIKDWIVRRLQGVLKSTKDIQETNLDKLLGYLLK